MSGYRDSDDRWELESPVYASIEVIEPAPKRKTGKKGKPKKVKKVPFGFARALPTQKKKR